MILSDKDILEALEKDKIKIEPFDKSNLQPSTIDLFCQIKFGFLIIGRQA